MVSFKPDAYAKFTSKRPDCKQIGVSLDQQDLCQSPRDEAEKLPIRSTFAAAWLDWQNLVNRSTNWLPTKHLGSCRHGPDLTQIQLFALFAINSGGEPLSWGAQRRFLPSPREISANHVIKTGPCRVLKGT